MKRERGLYKHLEFIFSQSREWYSNICSCGREKKEEIKIQVYSHFWSAFINKDLDAVTFLLCKTEKIGRILEAKKETTPPVTSQETEDVLELHKRNQKDIEKIKVSGRTLASKLSVP